MLDWRISLTAFVVLITAFAFIWPRVSTNWEQEFRSAYESVSDDTPIIDDFFDVYLDEDRNMLIYVREECDAEDIQSDFLLHVMPADINDIPDPRQQYGFDNFDFFFDGHGLRFDDKCVIQYNLPDYDIVSIRTGQYIQVGDELPPIWIEQAPIAPVNQGVNGEPNS